MKKQMFKRAVFLCLCIIWIFVIFSFSLQSVDVSKHASGGFSEWILTTTSTFFPGQTVLNYDNLQVVVRKGAHISEFLLLGILLSLFFHTFDNVRKTKVFMAAMILSLVALTDETIQLFVPGRGPGIKDFFIDFTGGSIGIILTIFVLSCVSSIAKTPKEDTPV